jgi:alpha-beta hydrolase superfamily lysophospholipase
VIVISTSTGGSLAAWAATQPGASDGVAAIAFISPNFGVKASGAEILTIPWGREIAELIAGKERSFAPRNPLHAKFWTYRYPMAATLPMAALTELAYGAPVEKATIPALFIFSDSDQVVRPDRTREIAGRWGAAHKLVPVDDTGDRDNHVIAGDALSPSTTASLAQRIVAWVKAVTE